MPVAAHHHVLRLQVAVDDPPRVRGREPLGDLRGESEQPSRRQGTAVQGLAEALPFHELHHDVRDAPFASDVVDGDDVRMAERRRRARLELEAAQTLRIRREVLGEDLQRDVAFEPGVTRAVDLAHSARAERRDDLVRTEVEAAREHGGIIGAARQPTARARARRA